MTLRDYLHFKRITVTSFAKQMLVSRSYMNLIVEGHTKPSIRLARDIQNATEGEVTSQELLNLSNEIKLNEKE